MASDRITLNGPDHPPPGHPDAVDEVVHTGVMHFEMLGDDHAYIALWVPGHELTQAHLTVRARPMTRAERRAARERDRTRLRDLPKVARSFIVPKGLLPRCRAAWATYREQAGPQAVLEVWVQEDDLGLTEESAG